MVLANSILINVRRNILHSVIEDCFVGFGLGKEVP